MQKKDIGTADSLPYEKVGKNEPVCIADEVLFEIPESWEWVRLGNVIDLQSGQDMTPDKYNSNGDGIPYITGASNIESGKILINRWTDCGRTFAYKGDILLTCKGTVGTMAVLQESQVHIARQIMAIRPIGELYVSYIQLVLQTLVESLKAAAKSMIPGISRDDVLQSLFPVPPFNEQQRIASKFSTIIPYIEQYSMVDTELSSLNSIFSENLKKSILQEAIQGQLVPQDPSDEPASVLLERIRAEKEQLIQEGKIKRDKHESVIYRRDNSHYEKLDGIERCIDDEIPFNIPDTWTFVRLQTICKKITDGEHKTPKRVTDYCGFFLLSARNVRNGYISLNDVDYVDKTEYINISKRCSPVRNDILISCSGSVGRCCTVDDDNNYVMVRSAAMISPIQCNSKYIMYAIQSPMVQEQISEKIKQAVQANLFQGAIRELLIPVPTLEEQFRIVNQIETILPVLKKLR